VTAGGWNSSRIVLAQNTTANTAKIGHSKVYAQLSALPDSARCNCHMPSASIPITVPTMMRCQASHLGVIRKRQLGASVPGMAEV